MLKKPVRILIGLDNGIAWVEKFTLGFGVLGMTVISIANVFMRNVLDQSLTFADELNQALIILVTFAGIGYAARQGRHIRMTAIYDQLGRLPRKLMMLLITASTAALLLALAWFSLDYALQTRMTGSVTPSLQIPLWIIYAVAPFGLTVGGIQYLLTFVRNLLEHDVYVSFTHPDEYDDVPTPEI